MALFRKLKNTLFRRSLQKDVADELAWHLEQRALRNMKNGMDEESARREAARRLGNLTLAREQTVEADLLTTVELWARDVRHAFLLLTKAPGFAATAVLTLGLGIGASTVVFTIMRQVVMDYLPVPQPERLVLLHNRGLTRGYTLSNGMNSYFSYPLYRDLNEASQSIFAGVLARLSTRGVLTRQQSSELVTCELVSGNYFQVLKVQPWRGRVLARQDDLRPGGHSVAVLSYAYWQRAFGSNEKVIGETVRINHHPYAVVGVAPPGFYGIDMGSPSDVFVPMMMKAQITPTWDGLLDRESHWCNLAARLKSDVSLEKAQAALKVIYAPLVRVELAQIHSPSPSFVKEFEKSYIELTPGGRGYADLREALRQPLRYLALMVALLLLITIVNVANLLIARATARQREIAIRLSIGAGRLILIRQLLAESLILSLAGGVLGAMFTYGATPALLHALGSKLSESGIQVLPDRGVLLFATVVSLGSGIAFGLLPAWQATRADVSLALKTEGASGHTGEKTWLRRGLVSSQIAFSLVLLSTALLFSRSLSNIKNLKTGLRVEGLLTFKVDPGAAGYSQARAQAFGEGIRERLRNLSDVESAAIATVPLLENNDTGSNIWVAGYKAPTHDDEEVRTNALSPDFFQVMRIPLLQGRSLQPADLSTHPNVAVVNSSFAAHFFAGRNPIGGTFGFGSGDDRTAWTIVGVVADSQHTTLRSKIERYVYLPYGTRDKLGVLTFYVRTRGKQDSPRREIREVIRRADLNLPVYDLRSLEQTIDEGLFPERGLKLVSEIFAALAVLLATVGLYGVMSYSATRRRREFGIRMAIGADRRAIMALLLREAVLIGSIGILVALPFLYGAGKLIEASLYGVSAHDPLVLSAAAVLLLFVCLLAGTLPAISAARTDPQNALRAE